MGISLYTSRVILEVLGVEDFGIYNLVGGVVVLLSFLNNAMSSATQRFINMEKASRIAERVREVFNISLKVHFIIALFVLLFAQTVGLWFLNHSLSIPNERIYAANVIYQISMFTTLIEIVKTPYSAVILANERMSFYAIVGVLGTVLKLSFVMLLSAYFGSLDKLILYAVFMMFISLVGSIILYVYCRKYFADMVSYKSYRNRPLFFKIISFSGWSLFGQVAVLSATQGVAMVINIFVGIAANAAIGIANQINGAIYSFVSNAQVAFNPQINQTYAEGNSEGHIALVLRASRFSFFLIAIICTPVLVGMDYILYLWLGDNVPDYTDRFAKIVILSSVVTSLSGPFWMSAYSVGNIRRYQIILSSLAILVLPISLALLAFGYEPTAVFLAKFLLDVVIFAFRVFYFRSTLAVDRVQILRYLRSTMILFVLIFLISILGEMLSINSWQSLIWYSFLVELVVFFLVVFLGVEATERRMIYSFIRQKVGR